MLTPIKFWGEKEEAPCFYFCRTGHTDIKHDLLSIGGGEIAALLDRTEKGLHTPAFPHFYKGKKEGSEVKGASSNGLFPQREKGEKLSLQGEGEKGKGDVSLDERNQLPQKKKEKKKNHALSRRWGKEKEDDAGGHRTNHFHKGGKGKKNNLFLITRRKIPGGEGAAV